MQILPITHIVDMNEDDLSQVHQSYAQFEAILQDKSLPLERRLRQIDVMIELLITMRMLHASALYPMEAFLDGRKRFYNEIASCVEHGLVRFIEYNTTEKHLALMEDLRKGEQL